MKTLDKQGIRKINKYILRKYTLLIDNPRCIKESQTLLIFKYFIFVPFFIFNIS